jgi:uncharacterized protein YecT (DUF1311 family)
VKRHAFGRGYPRRCELSRNNLYKQSDIVNVICSNMEKDLENAKLMYRAKEQMHYLNEQSKTEALQKAQEKITSIEG